MVKKSKSNFLFHFLNPLSCLFFLLLQSYSVFGQFPGPVGSVGTTAIHKDSSIFVGWATSCVVTRGYQDIANTTLGFTNVGLDTNGTKQAGYNPVVSLGDEGSAILTFNSPISNGAGFDFAVFENAFSDLFLELAFVEVSSDGLNFYRFPATSNTQTLIQIGPFDTTSNASKLNNLAGKYRALYGTPFDLQELQGVLGLDINHITHVKVTDVIGCVTVPYARYDKNGNAVNDPYPTSFGSGGFDLDAVGVIHQQVVGYNEKFNSTEAINIYPNPAHGFITVYTEHLTLKKLVLCDLNGEVLKQTTQHTLLINDLEAGVYLLHIIDETGASSVKKIICY